MLDMPDQAATDHEALNLRKRISGDSSSESERSDDESWAVSDGEGSTIMREEPRNTRKTRASMKEETISLVMKMLNIRRDMFACPKPNRDAQRMLTLNRMKHVGPMAKCSKCSRKKSGWQLVSLLGITPDSPSTPIEQSAVEPLEAVKAANAALQKTNQETAKQIGTLQKTNTQLLNEMRLLRAQVTELTKLIKGKHFEETPQAEPVDLDGPEEMDTGEDIQETPEKRTVEPHETRAPSFAEAVLKNLRVRLLDSVVKESLSSSVMLLVHMHLHIEVLQTHTQPCLHSTSEQAEEPLDNSEGHSKSNYRLQH